MFFSQHLEEPRDDVSNLNQPEVNQWKYSFYVILAERNLTYKIMKKIFYMALYILTSGCIAQNPIVNITQDDGSQTPNTYYKDVDNHLNQFEGTWLYANGADTLRIVMVKKVKTYNGSYYEDLLIGEYQYMVNGVTIINTLSDLNTVYPNQIRHQIDGNIILINTNRPLCTDCALNEKRVMLSFSDTESYGTMVVRRIMQGGKQAIKIKIRKVGPSARVVGTAPSPDFKVPAGEYVLIKQ